MYDDAPLRFFLFSGPDYYPGGGMSDFESAHPTLEAAEDAMTTTLKREDWAHIAELHPTEGLVVVKTATRDD
jgi:hypothetical protein